MGLKFYRGISNVNHVDSGKTQIISGFIRGLQDHTEHQVKCKNSVQLAVACMQTGFSNFREIPGRNFGPFGWTGGQQIRYCLMYSIPYFSATAPVGLEITLLVLVSCGAMKMDGGEKKDWPSSPWQSCIVTDFELYYSH